MGSTREPEGKKKTTALAAAARRAATHCTDWQQGLVSRRGKKETPNGGGVELRNPTRAFTLKKFHEALNNGFIFSHRLSTSFYFSSGAEGFSQPPNHTCQAKHEPDEHFERNEEKNVRTG